MCRKRSKGSPHSAREALKHCACAQIQVWKTCRSYFGPGGPQEFSKLGFVHRRSVFEPPEPKVDYLYYVFGTLEILILVKGAESITT